MISPQGYWVGVDAQAHHIHDPALSKELQDFFKQEGATSIVDLGCGMGTYVREFRQSGLNADGYDGNPDTHILSDGTCGVADLTQPLQFNEPYDWVMSLEVGEHIPAQFEKALIGNLHASNKRGIVLSWAVKGQGGDGHVNEQSNAYIKSCVTALGYTNDTVAENKLRAAASLRWFKNTIMVFRRS